MLLHNGDTTCGFKNVIKKVFLQLKETFVVAYLRFQSLFSVFSVWIRIWVRSWEQVIESLLDIEILLID